MIISIDAEKENSVPLHDKNTKNRRKLPQLDKGYVQKNPQLKHT